MAERRDRLHLKGYSIIQNKDYFCYGIDAVLLSDFALKNSALNDSSRKENVRVIDLGTGNAIIPVLLCALSKAAVKIFGLEVQEEIADLAERSVKLNSLEDSVTIRLGDIKNAENIFTAGEADIAVSNPPYMKVSEGRQSSNKQKMTARQEVLCTLDDVVKAAAFVLGGKGQFFMIHRARRREEIINSLKKYGFNSIKIQDVKPFKEKAATMVLTAAEFDEDIKVHHLTDLVIYESPGVYTKQVKKIYESS